MRFLYHTHLSYLAKKIGSFFVYLYMYFFIIIMQHLQYNYKVQVTSCKQSQAILSIESHCALVPSILTNLNTKMLPVGWFVASPPRGQLLPGVSDGVNGIEQSLSSHNKSHYNLVPLCAIFVREEGIEHHRLLSYRLSAPIFSHKYGWFCNSAQ